MSKSKSAARSGSVAVKRGARSSISVDEKLAAKVKKISKSKTTTEAVERALDFYARTHDYSKVLALYGTNGVAEGYDPKSAYSVK